MSESNKNQSDEFKKIILTDYVKSCIDKVALAQGFQNYTIELSTINNGFVGAISKVKIQEKDKEKSTSVVLKSPLQEKLHYDLKAMPLFEREVYFFSEILPEILKIQDENGIAESEGFCNTPKIFLADFNKEKAGSLIIMEDLNETGLKMTEKYETTNFDHAKLVVTALGKLHAVSLALKAEKPKVFEKIKKMTDLFTENFFDERMSAWFEAEVDKAAATLPEDSVEYRAKVLGMKEDAVKLMKKMVDPENAEPFAVLTHGDCWSNNFMYRYEGDTPTDFILLDWQVSRYSSPALDLLHFLFSCTSEEMRKNHFEELIEIYQQSAAKLLEKLTQKVKFPMEVVKNQMKEFGNFSFLMAAILIVALTRRTEVSLDEESAVRNSALSNKDYEERMRGAIMDMIRYGYL